MLAVRKETAQPILKQVCGFTIETGDISFDFKPLNVSISIKIDEISKTCQNY